MDVEPSPPPSPPPPQGDFHFFILTPPLKMTGNQTLKFLWAPFQKFVCIKGQNFVGISEKKNQQPLFKNPSSLQGQGKGRSRKELSEDSSSSSSIFIYTRNRIILHGLPRNRV